MRTLLVVSVLLVAGCSSPRFPWRRETLVRSWEHEAVWRAGYERRVAQREVELEALQAAVDARARARSDYAAANRGARPDEVLDAIAAESIAIGMTPAEALLVVEAPVAQKVVTTEAVVETWTVAGVTLTFRDAVLVEWAETPSTGSERTRKMPQPTVPANTAS